MCVSSKTSLLGVMLDCFLEKSERQEQRVTKYIITTWPWKTDHDSTLWLLVHSFRQASSFYIAQRFCKHRSKGSETMAQKIDFEQHSSATFGTYLLQKVMSILALGISSDHKNRQKLFAKDNDNGIIIKYLPNISYIIVEHVRIVS